MEYEGPPEARVVPVLEFVEATAWLQVGCGLPYNESLTWTISSNAPIVSNRPQQTQLNVHFKNSMGYTWLRF